MNAVILASALLCMAFMPAAALEEPVATTPTEQTTTIELNFHEEATDEIVIDDDETSAPLYTSEEPPVIVCAVEEKPCTPRPNWYFEVKPGYYYFTDSSMRQFFNNGGFTIRGEAGYRLWGPFTLWFDGGYFHKDGHALGGYETTKLTLATLSIGLKAIWYPHDRIAFYLGAGPRLFLMMLDNDSPFVRSNDNEIGLGGAFNGGFFVFPIPSWKNVFLDLFADYSLKTMKVDPDEISSDDYDVNVSGLSFGIGLGVRF